MLVAVKRANALVYLRLWRKLTAWWSLIMLRSCMLTCATFALTVRRQWVIWLVVVVVLFSVRVKLVAQMEGTRLHLMSAFM